MMKDLKVTLHFREKFQKECFLDLLTEEKFNTKIGNNRVKDLIMHYRIDEVSELDGSVHYSNNRERYVVTDEFRDSVLQRIIDQSAKRIQTEFFEDLVKKLEELKDEFLLENCLKDAIHDQIRPAFDSSLLELRIKQLQEETNG